MTLIITEAVYEDYLEVHHLYDCVIKDAFKEESIDPTRHPVDDEIQYKQSQFIKDIESKETHYLLARIDGMMIGVISYGVPSEDIVSCIDALPKGCIEIGSIYIRPEYQRQGIAKQLLKKVFHILDAQELKQFCMDSGYKRAQNIWTTLFGPPCYNQVSDWGENVKHMIWIVDVKQAIHRLK